MWSKQPRTVNTHLSDTIQALTAAGTLSLINQGLTDTDLTSIGNVNPAKDTRVIDLSGNEISIISAKVINQWVTHCRQLRELSVYGNKLGPSGINVIIEAVKKHQSLEVLNAGFNAIQEKGARYLAAILSQHTSLRKLNISLNNINPAGITAILRALTKNNMMLDLNLSHNFIDAEGISALANCLEYEWTGITYLNIASMQITAKMCNWIAKALAINKTLISLDISGNDLKDEGVMLLLQSLKSNNSVRILNIRSVNLTPASLKNVMLFLKENKRITSINVAKNSMGSAENKNVAQHLINNFTLVNLDIDNNGVDAADQAAIFGYLERNRNLASDLYQACEQGNYDEAKRLLEKGVSPCSVYARKDKKTNEASVLHVAVQKNDKKLSKLLLDLKYGHHTELLSLKNTENKTVFDITHDHEMLALLNAAKTAVIVSSILMTAVKPTASIENKTAAPDSPIPAPLPVTSPSRSTLNTSGELLISFLVNPQDVTNRILISEQGGFGRVYKAILNREQIALKELKVERLSQTNKDAMNREASIMAQFNCAYLVRVIGFSFEPPTIYMEYMDFSLYDALYDKRISLGWKEKGTIAAHIAYGLEYLHKKEIIHRDIKSLNVLIKGQGAGIQAKLTDFGLAEAKIEVSTRTSVEQGAMAGTLLWLAPEILDGESVTELSDIYSMGIVLWEMIAEALPFKMANGNQNLITRFIVNGKYDYTLPANQAVLNNCPAYLVQAIKNSWAKDTHDRVALSETIKIIDAGNQLQDSLQSGFAPALVSTFSPK